MRRFRWLSLEALPVACDLRRCGWTLAEHDDGSAILLSDLTRPEEDPARTLIVGIAEPERRARLLNLGFGDVVGDCHLAELEARVLRLSRWVPRYRRHDRLELDIVVRDAFVAEQALSLHPREFGLLWRLMATPGQVVGKARLLREVWRLHHVPETNSLAVHACRLRGKLAAAGLVDVILTEGDGYWFQAGSSGASAIPLQPGPLQSGLDLLDAHVRLTDDPPLYETVQP